MPLCRGYDKLFMQKRLDFYVMVAKFLCYSFRWVNIIYFGMNLFTMI